MDDMESNTRTLPPNWRVAKDSDGKEYYFNELTGETSWTYPTAAEPTTAPAFQDNMPGAMVTGAVVEPQQSEYPPVSADFPVGVGAQRGGNGRLLSDTFGEGLPKLLLLVAASFVLMIQACITSGHKPGDAHSLYAIAVAVVSLGLTVGFMLFAKLRSAKFNAFTLQVPGPLGTCTLPQIFGLFMVAWWIPAALVLTCYEPFTTVSNAYIAIWVAVASSALYLSHVYTRVASAFQTFSQGASSPSLGYLAGIFIASVVVFLVSLNYTTKSFWAATYALVISIISCVFSALCYFLIDTKRLGLKGVKFAAAMFFIIWFLSIFFLTFDLDNEYKDVTGTVTGTGFNSSATATVRTRDDFMKSFVYAGNGFVATWAAAYFSFAWAYQEFYGEDINLKSRLARSFSWGTQKDAEATPAAGPGRDSF